MTGAARIYLDHAAATPMLPAARALLGELLDRPLANPSSPHAEGRAWKDTLEAARTRAARAFGCRPREIVFTGGGTEAARIAVHGLAGDGAPSRVVVSGIEHAAVREAAGALAPRGVTVVEVPPDAAGGVDPDRLADAARDGGAAFVALMLANHEMGAVQPVAETARALADLGVPLLCDAALGPGRVPCRRDDLGADVVLFSGTAFGGAPGASLLYVRRGTRLAPLGGGLQEERLRPGTENAAAWAATALAFERALDEQPTRAARYRALVQAFVDALDDDVRWTPVGPGTEGLPGLLTLEVPGVEGEALMINMDLEGIAVATGSTCALGSADPSPSLLAMGFARARAASTIRISVGEGTDADSIHRAATTFGDVVARLRALGHR